MGGIIMTIAVDFDGTCVTYAYPNVGKNIGAEIVLEKLSDKGHKIILYTMRSHPSEKTEKAGTSGMIPATNDCLQDAIDWFVKYDIPLYGVNDNPLQHSWTNSNKVFADVYIDDSAIGIPLKAVNEKELWEGSTIHPYAVDWIRIAEMLCESEILSLSDLKDIRKKFDEKYKHSNKGLFK